MTKKRKLFIITIAIFLFFSLLIPMLVNLNFINSIIKSSLESQIGKSVHGVCTVKSLRAHISYLNVDSIYIDGESFTCSVSKTRVRINPYLILMKKLTLSRVHAEDIKIEIKKVEGKGESIPATLPSLRYFYPFENFQYKIDMPQLSVTNLSVTFDTFNFTGLSMNGTASVDKKRSLLYVNFISGKLAGYCDIKGGYADIACSFENAAAEIDIEASNASAKGNMVFDTSGINISSLNIRADAKKIDIAGKKASLKASLNLSGLYNGDVTQFKGELNLERGSFADYSAGPLACIFRYSKDTLFIDKALLKSGSGQLEASGEVEIKQPLSLNLDMKFDSFGISEIIRSENIKEHMVFGEAHLSYSQQTGANLIIDSLRGFYGIRKISMIKGAVSTDGSEASFRNLIVEIDGGYVKLSGRVGKGGIAVDAELKSFPAGLLSEIQSGVQIGGYISGDVNSGIHDGTSRVKYDINVENAFYGENIVEYASLSGYVDLRDFIPGDMLLTGNIVNGHTSGINISIIYFEIMKKGDKIYSDIDGLSDIMDASYSGTYTVGKNWEYLSGKVEKLDIHTDGGDMGIENPFEIYASGNGYSVSNLNLKGAYLSLKLDGSMKGDSLDVNFALKDRNLGMISYLTGAKLKGRFDASLSASGSILSPRLKAEARLSAFSFEGISVDSLVLNADLKDKHLDINYFNIYYKGKMSYIYGRAELNSFTDFESDSMDMHFRIEGVDSSFFAPLYDIFYLKKGYANAEGSLYGCVLNPQMKGSAVVNEGDVYILSLGTRIKNAKGYATLMGDSVIIDSLKGETERGSVSLTGIVKMKGYSLDRYFFRIDATGAHVEGIDYVDAYGNCGIEISGNAKRPVIIGDITITEGISNLPFLNLSQGGGAITSVDSSYIELRFNAEKGGVWLKNSFVDVELAGKVVLKKDVSRWNVTGSADIKRGYYYYLDKKFTISTGKFDLIETQKIVEPVISLESDIKMSYTDIDGRKDATIYLKASGAAEKPVISLYSEPSLSMDNILSILSFNSTVSSLSDIDQVSKQLPEKALQIYLRNKYLSYISSSIGVDQLDIETNLLSDERSAKLSVGKYIGRNIFVSYTHDIFSFSRDMFKIEYNFMTNTDIVTERDEQGNFNTGVQFKYRF